MPPYRIMIADDHHQGQRCPADSFNMPGQLAFLRGRGAVGPIRVAREEHGIDAQLERFVQHALQGPAEIQQPGMNPRRRVQPAIGLSAEVKVGQVKKADAAFGGSLHFR